MKSVGVELQAEEVEEVEEARRGEERRLTVLLPLLASASDMYWHR